jgi:hypothetical protein
LNKSFFLKRNLFFLSVFLLVYIIYIVFYIISHYPKLDYDEINSYKNQYQLLLKTNKRYINELNRLKEKYVKTNKYFFTIQEKQQIKQLITEFNKILEKLKIAKCDTVTYHDDNSYINIVNFKIYCNTSIDAGKYKILFHYFLNPYLKLKDLKVNNNIVSISIVKIPK